MKKIKKFLTSSKGDIAWEYIAAIIICIAVLIIMILFADLIKDKIKEAFGSLAEIFGL
ncbi:hypothetical protein HZB88_01615 [archaeon]|nr:hypothetical protein [archaeon]